MALVLLDLAQPPPVREAVVNRATGLFSTAWETWLLRMPRTLHAIPSVINLVSLEDQGAAISATDLANGVLTEGVYRISYHARITTAAGVSSSLTVAFIWTHGAVVQTYTGTSITGNTVTTYQSGTFLIHCDADSDLTYEAAYASNAAGVMKYSLDVMLEKIRE